jgi:hypothetical protein
MTGIYLCYAAGILVLIAAVVLATFRTLTWRDPLLYLIPAVAIIVVALLWGNIGVIYSHAGWTG